MTAYSYVWEYRVEADRRTAFEQAYGPQGPWVALFRRAPGYVRTDLLHDRADPARYLSIDHWRSLEDYQAFRASFAAEYAAIDRECDALTTHEQALGEFAGADPQTHEDSP